MKLKRMLLMAIAAMLLMVNLALAEETLSARLDGNMLKITWNAQGDCVLTVYRNKWPISVTCVDGASGGTEMKVQPGGRYSVRLRTPNGCWNANAAIAEKPTAEPTVKPTPVVTKKPTEVPTVKPTVVPTPVPTAEPTVVPTAKPTAVPTAIPTVKPTAAPTAAPTATVPSNDGQSMTSMAAEVISQVNAERAKYGLEPLTVSAQLTSAACIRANEIVELFSHTRPDGSSWSTVSSAAMGENIAKGQSSADRVMAAWMSSEGHRANILRESFGSIGVCALKVNGVIHWVQLFGR